MANYKWPNVYPNITDLSGVVATNSVTACAYVGEAEFGPINKPTFLSTLRNYTSTFGALNSAKYGYAGYSLAVASESIDSHYFVRVVRAGDPENHDDEKDAKYASIKVPAKDKQPEDGKGLYVEEMEAVLKTENAASLFMEDATTPDENNALIFVADNPNNLKLSVRLSDSTVNENRAYAFSSVEYTPENEEGVYSGVISDVHEEVLKGLKAGESIEIVRSSKTDQNGVYEVTNLDETARTITFKYNAPLNPDYHEEESGSGDESGESNENEKYIEPVNLTSGKVSEYPKSNERTIQVDVYMTKGKLTQNVETFQYCTLYHAKDNHGESTFIEDVINDKSKYVRVYVNPNLLEDLEEDEVLEISLSNSGESYYSLVGGQSGARPESGELISAWDLFKDRTQTTVSLLMNSGYSNASETSYQNKMLEVAEYRRDCFCLFDMPMSEVESDDAIDWRKNVLGTNSYRAALSSPWVKTYDTVQGRANFVMCPSAFVAKLIGQAGDPWKAPAGPNRGIISSSTVSPTGLTQAYDPVVGGTLYADNQINCLVRDASAGYVNWGQRTLQQKPSALDRINVARTVIYIETILRDAARWHLFENNTPYERMQITLQFSSFLDTILSAEGIAAYKVICDDTNNTPIVIQNNQLVIDVILTPVYAAESIILNTTITGADSSVEITSSAN